MRLASAIRAGRPASSKAVVVGQLNERLDVDLLLELARCGVQLLLVGPRYERTVDTKRKLDQLVACSNVEWLGRQPYVRLPSLLGGVDLGLTPYRDTPFNRSSFPLKTLEYLAAGLRVVSTDLPSAQWLDTPLVDVATNHSIFVETTIRRLAEGWSPDVASACHDVAAHHSWASRAEALMLGLTASENFDVDSRSRSGLTL
jgi:teichuronic acid biosynthesis glycosyltransferase TuaH